MMRREKQNRTSRLLSSSSGDRLSNSSEFDTIEFSQNKRKQLIMNTIEDIKRSLLDQSIELNGLHDSDT